MLDKLFHALDVLLPLPNVTWRLSLQIAPYIFQQHIHGCTGLGGVGVVHHENDHPISAALIAHVARHRFHAIERAGFDMGLPGDVFVLQTFFHRAIHTGNR